MERLDARTGRDVGRPLVTGIELFASGRDDTLARRPSDIALAIVAGLLVVVTGIANAVASPSEPAIQRALAGLPDLLEPLWRVAYFAPLAWLAIVFVATVTTRRWPLVRNITLAVAGAFGIAELAGRVATGTWPPAADLFRTSGPPHYPALLLAMTSAGLSAASPYVTRPFRHFARWLIGFMCGAAIYLDVAFVSHVIAGLAVAFGTAAAIHLVFGSPGGRPTIARIRLALEGLGLHVHDIHPAAMQTQGVVELQGVDDRGPLLVKVYGRDAWDAQLLSTAWRVFAYRNADATIALRRVQQVEHEAFVTLLAERAGVAVQPVVVAGAAGRGDALLVVRPVGTPIENVDGDDIDDALLDAMWANLARLHAAGLAHGRIDTTRVSVDGVHPVLTDLASGTAVGSDENRWTDQAQLVVATALRVGSDRAFAAAHSALGDEGLKRVAPYVQPAALPPELRERVRRAGLDLDALRTRMPGETDTKPPNIVRIRRVNRRSIINMVLFLIVVITLYTAFAGIDWSSVSDQFQTVNWWWVGFGLIVAQIARGMGAFSSMGASRYPLPVAPTVEKEFGLAYINLAIPSSAARVAVNVRFFGRVGVPPTPALTIGVLDSFAGFVVQVMFLLLLPLTADKHVDLNFDTSDLSGIGTIVLIAIGVLAVAAVLLLCSSRIRNWLKNVWRDTADSLRVLRSPSKLTLLFSANIVQQVLYAVAIGCTVRAFGASAPLTSLILINTVVTLFAGLLPIPGGVGVAEAGLAWGLTHVGIPQATALAIAIVYRVISFYAPPVWGYFAYRNLEHNGYL